MKLLREPLFHFIVLGLLLFGLYAWVKGPEGEGGRSRIVVSEADVEWMRATWEKRWGRPPSHGDLNQMIRDFVREQVLYREAVALGLDKDDTIVRRRLAQKMEFLVADAAVPSEPEEPALRAYFEVNQDRYRKPVRLTFTHIYFSSDRRGANAHRDAETVLASLRAEKQPPTRATDRGDRFMLQYDYVQKSQAQVAREFGAAFAQHLVVLEPGRWQGPIQSGYGWHLVYVSERVNARLSDFGVVRERVKNDFVAEQRREANELAYQQLRERYKIDIEAQPGNESHLALKNEQ